MRPRVFFYSGGPNLWFVFWMMVFGAAAAVAAAVWGLAKVSEWIFPCTEQLGVLLLGVFVAGIVPLSLVREWRKGLAGAGFLIAGMYRIGVWMTSFLLLWKWVGFWAAPAVLVWPLAAPMAIIGSALKADWTQAAGLLLAMAVARMMRLYAQWLAAHAGDANRRPRGRATPGSGGTTVIETVVVETREADEPRRISNDGELK